MTNLKRIIFICLLTGALSPASAGVFALAPVDDTYVYSGEPSIPHGDVSVIATGYDFPHTEGGWISYLKFDLSGIPSDQVITGATLNLYQVLGAGYAQIGTDLFHIDNDTWNENTLTWNNQPLGFTPYGTPVLGTLIASNPNGFSYVGWSAWNLFEKSAWNADVDQKDSFLSLQLAEMYLGTQTHDWCSTESDLTNCLAPGETGPATESRRPYLTITTAVVPLPQAIYLFGFGIIGLIRMTFRKRSRECHRMG